MKAAVLLIALCGFAAVHGLNITKVQDQLNAQVAAVVAAEGALVVVAGNSTVSPVVIDQLKDIEQAITGAEAALSAYDSNGEVAITNVDNQIDMALALIKSVSASTPGAGTVLDVIKDSLCTLAASIHTTAASEGVTVEAKSPSRCFSDKAPTLLWQVQLNEANARIVALQNGLSPKALKKTQALTTTIQEAAAAAGVYSQDPTLGFNQMTSALSSAQVEIAQLLPFLKSKGKQADLQTVNALLSAVQSSMASYAGDAGVTGTVASSPASAPGHKKAPKKGKGGLKIAEAEAPAPAAAIEGVGAPAPARRLLA